MVLPKQNNNSQNSLCGRKATLNLNFGLGDRWPSKWLTRNAPKRTPTSARTCAVRVVCCSRSGTSTWCSWWRSWRRSTAITSSPSTAPAETSWITSPSASVWTSERSRDSSARLCRPWTTCIAWESFIGEIKCVAAEADCVRDVW